MPPKISVCIPAYNRAGVLPELLDSIVAQDFNDFEIVICEDRSPQREQIAEVVNRYSSIHPGLIRYFENSENLGYDGNLRNLFEKSQGEYCLFMGNDDLMCEGALAKVAAALSRHPNIGVLLRSYAAFEGSPDNIVQTFRYFDQELFFPAGAQTISTIYRRSVVIPGMVIRREAALRSATTRFDGTLLYQLYLVANILVEMNAVYLPDVIVLYRNGGVPDFGNSAAEQGKFQPKEQTPESSVHFMRGMLAIAQYIERERQVKIFRPIVRDIANYSYPILAIQAQKPLGIFLKYGWSLARLGLARSPLFLVWFFAILILGTKRVERLIVWIKKRLGHTPSLGNVYRGESR
ncbi:MAG: glycosyltransferase family 2 protein [Gallionellaceae bacterium]|nr:MAG: glycosyltransferase family 2 protein [Gallionellaceae bacterium]